MPVSSLIKPEVKMCGVTSAHDAKMVMNAHADYIGFIHYPPSPRHVSLSHLQPLLQLTAKRIRRDVVLVDPTMAELTALMDACAQYLPDYFQLHGNETPAYCHQIRSTFNIPVIKAIIVKDAADIEAYKPYEPVVDALLFDTKPSNPTQAGGTGMVFDWDLLNHVSPTVPWFLAGGLNNDNIGKACALHPSVVDISSGIEREAGVKEGKKITELMHSLQHNAS